MEVLDPKVRARTFGDYTELQAPFGHIKPMPFDLTVGDFLKNVENYPIEKHTLFSAEFQADITSDVWVINGVKMATIHLGSLVFDLVDGKPVERVW